ncbi:hypothetical protein BHU72_12390 [Desulfuribacillus stibiiarsenatis]|uniref:Cytochrome c assembly protein domain-containing protein n=1 Tax=Desulfuribacillus stibiiarsenatis TaxID=1390249 RepID=A0A1E5L263_9FIRM|nr:cytochrome c biogenesis protein CcsA [Desulfuribacillus stibiiarsenatis]OEH84196.1 hypothetical protein BHU72_12390 [Desulfuribacillus stibiiarsenatis]
MAENYVWVYDLMILIYAASVILYFYDFLHSNKRVNKVAFSFLIGVWIIQTLFFHLRMKELDYIPVMTLFETLFFYSWILVTLTLVINYFYKMDLMVFIVNCIGFCIVMFNMFISKQAEPVVNEILQGDLLTIHIVFAIASYGLFFISFLFSGLYVWQTYLLKKKKIFSNIFRKIPPLDKLDQFSYLLAIVAFPILFISLVLGTIWAYMNNIYIWTDVKFIMSFIVLIVYALYLHRRVALGWQGRKLAIWNMIGFSTVVLNYLLTKVVSTFHQWI